MKLLSREELLKHSFMYDATHKITQKDVDKASKLHSIIESSRHIDKPMPGDIMICRGPKKEYLSGHVQRNDLSAHSAICVQPYIPFVEKVTKTEHKVLFDTSGGYWFSISKDKQYRIKLIGQRSKAFKAWGHCGACANGAFTFTCKVNVWYYASSVIY